MTGKPDALLDTIRKLVREELRHSSMATLAIVQDIHPHASDGDDDNYSCSVKLRDSEVLLQKVPVATARMGLASVPAVDDLVLVQFINGDANSPVIIGSLYNDEDRPPVNAQGQWVCELPLGARDSEGVHIAASSADTAALEIRIGGSLVLALKDDDPVVSVDVGSGAAKLTIDSDGTISLQGGRSLTVEAGTDLVLKGNNVKIEGAGEVTVKGAVINLN
jgi:phage baseplate assembly protein gpV